MKKINKLSLLLFLPLFVISCKNEKTDSSSSSSSENGSYNHETEKLYFTMENGELVRPTDYRTWVYVGSPLTPNDLNNGKAPFPEMHNVYIDPASFNHYKETGEFREGTILLKELVSTGEPKSAVSGKGYFQEEFIGLEASVKSKEHFSEEPGNWAIFSFTDAETGVLKNKAAAMPTESCNACHQANAADDFVFTQYYPVLRAAKGVGEANPENSAKRFSENEMKEKSVWDATVPSPESVDGFSLKEADLFAWLQKGDYKNWKAQEKEAHPSAGPHETVRSFLNDKLAASIEAGNDSHPVGAMAVKEQFKDGKSFGWAFYVKTQEETEGGKGWFWYEVTSDKDINEKFALGNGVTGCTSCHNLGKDMVRISYPFE